MTRVPMACLLATLAALPAVSADDDARRRLIEQKAALVQRVLDDAPIPQRVAASGNAQARAQLARASEAHRRGLALAAQGDLAASEAALDEAVVAIGVARRLAPDPARKAAETRARLDTQRQSATALLAAARRHAVRPADPQAAAAIEQGAALLARAERRAAEDRHEEALVLLLATERALLDALARALGTTTLDYTVRFDNPDEELRYENERHRSYRGLVPIALADLRPAPAERARVDLYVERASRLHEASAARAARGEIAGALDAIREATALLQRALAAAGLAVPTQ